MVCQDDIENFYTTRIVGQAPNAVDLRQFLEILWRQHAQAVYVYLCARGCSAQDAENACQQAFVQAMEFLAKGRAKSDRVNFRAWLRQIAVNASRDRHRKDRRYRQWGRLADGAEEFDCDIPDSDGTGPESRLAKSEQVAALRTCVESLAARDRQLIIAAYLQERAYSELADELSLAVSVVRLRVHRARRRLFDCMQDKGAA